MRAFVVRADASCTMNHSGNCQAAMPFCGAVESCGSGGGAYSLMLGTSSSVQSLSARRGSTISSLTPVQCSSPATRTEWLGRSSMAPGPKVLTTCPCRSWPGGSCLRRWFMVRPPGFNLDAVHGLEPEVDTGLHVAQRAVRPELPCRAGRLFSSGSRKWCKSGFAPPASYWLYCKDVFTWP